MKWWVPLVTLAIGLALGWYYAPRKIDKIVSTDNKVTHRDVVTTITKRPGPSGPTVTTTIVDHTQVKEDAKQTETKIVPVSRDSGAWTFTALGGWHGGDVPTGTLNIFVGALEHKLFGPISVGVWASSRGDYGLGLSLRW